MREKLKSINNLPFLVCLALLLWNDFYLKVEYHNGLTGKLSDFCGLFVFASFWSALLPSRKRVIYYITALLFVMWKSPFSQGFIDFFGSNVYPIYRVVDATDLMALVTLPVAYYFNLRRNARMKLNPILISVVTLFSFCATSLPIFYQEFDQPQYLLFEDGIIEDEFSETHRDYSIHKVDGLLVVDINRLRTGRKAPLEDEYQKTQVLKKLDLRFLREIAADNRYYEVLSQYKGLRDSLTVGESTSILLNIGLISDHLHFNGTRLHGIFQRFENEKLIIEGQYKNGIEDSIWTFYNTQNEISTKKYFEQGELFKVQQFENSKIRSEIWINTRSITVRNKYFILPFIALLIIGLISKLYLNFKKLKTGVIIQYSHFYKVGISIILPIFIIILAKLFSSAIPDSYSSFVIGIIAEVVLIYIITMPLFLLIFYGIKIRTKNDLFYYIFLFALSTVFIEEIIYLNKIII